MNWLLMIINLDYKNSIKHNRLSDAEYSNTKNNSYTISKTEYKQYK